MYLFQTSSTPDGGCLDAKCDKIFMQYFFTSLLGAFFYVAQYIPKNVTSQIQKLNLFKNQKLWWLTSVS